MQAMRIRQFTVAISATALIAFLTVSQESAPAQTAGRAPRLDPALAGLFAKSSDTDAAGDQRIPILMLFDDAPQVETLARMTRDSDITIRYAWHFIPAIAADVPLTSLDSILAVPSVAAVELDRTARMFGEELDRSWGVKRIGAGFAHAQGYLGDGASLAILDTGIDYTHPELSGVYAGGYDFVNNDDDPFDDHGHGTHVAGIAASARNRVGVVGVSPGVELYGVKVISAGGGAQISDIISGIQWCVDNNIDVANLSLGLFADPGDTFRMAFEQAWENGLLCVASAGGFGTQGVAYPAKYDTVIAVSATDENNFVASFSGIGPEIEVAAPGVNIESAQKGGGYVIMSGTSMASPHVAGAAALVYGAGISDENHNNRINDEVRDRLAVTAIDLGDPGRDDRYGFGIINAQSALHAPLHLESSTFNRGEPAFLRATNATPGFSVFFAYSLSGTNVTHVNPLGVVLSLDAPRLAGTHRAGPGGKATLRVIVPRNAPATDLWLQAVEPANPSNLVKTAVQ